jgi:hypothetical protein
MTIKSMIKYVLDMTGADGLVNTDIECGCSIDDLCPCCNPHEDNCVLAYIHKDGLMYEESESGIKVQ